MTTTKGKVSVLIPSKNEIYLNQTIQGLLDNAAGDIEIIVNLDGYWPTEFILTSGEQKGVTFHQEMITDPRVLYIHRGEGRGMRTGINSAASLATGEYLLKSDAHCMYDKGFDEKLKADMQDNWIVIPRRKRLDADNWSIQDVGKPDVDYEFLSSPSHEGAKGQIWNERIKERLDIPEYEIDEDLSFQGSCWFMKKDYYWNELDGMQVEGYGEFVREAQELGLKCWLSGGKVMINKRTWYAHLHKGPKYGRMYFIDKHGMVDGERYCDDYWFNNRYPKAIYDLAWLIERFSPVPGWSPELIEQVRKK